MSQDQPEAIPAQQANPLLEAIQKIDNFLVRIPVKLAESNDQLTELRAIFIKVVRTYEMEIAGREEMLKKKDAYIAQIEKALKDANITLPEQPPKDTPPQ